DRGVFALEELSSRRLITQRLADFQRNVLSASSAGGDIHRSLFRLADSGVNGIARYEVRRHEFAARSLGGRHGWAEGGLFCRRRLSGLRVCRAIRAGCALLSSGTFGVRNVFRARDPFARNRAFWVRGVRL